jgi:hypothetical protein
VTRRTTDQPEDQNFHAIAFTARFISNSIAPNLKVHPLHIFDSDDHVADLRFRRAANLCSNSSGAADVGLNSLRACHLLFASSIEESCSELAPAG